MEVTALITCKNEEDVIGACLESIKWADEILVVDSGSEDRTVEIARAGGARVEFHEYRDAATQKNWAIPRASHEWVLVVDSDERVTPELAREIQALLSGEPRHAAYRIGRRNSFLGSDVRWGNWGSDAVKRLFLRDRARYPEKRVHADLDVDGTVGKLRGMLRHRTVRCLDDFFGKMNRYAGWWAEQACRDGRRAGFWQLAAHPAWHFFRSYVLKLGFLDGLAGLAIAELGAASVVKKYLRLREMRSGGK